METDTSPPSTCELCALARTRADAAGLSWTSQHERGRTVTWICPTCTRAQLWLIEAGLPVVGDVTRAAPLGRAA